MKTIKKFLKIIGIFWVAMMGLSIVLSVVVALTSPSTKEDASADNVQENRQEVQQEVKERTEKETKTLAKESADKKEESEKKQEEEKTESKKEEEEKIESKKKEEEEKIESKEEEEEERESQKKKEEKETESKKEVQEREINSKEESAEPPKSESSEKREQEYIFLDSDKRYLSEEEIRNMDADKLRIARNEIFARHGYIFQDEELQQYFKNMPWYTGTVPSDQFDLEAMFNDYEKKNIELISFVEENSNNTIAQAKEENIEGTDGADAPYLSEDYLEYYLKKNNIEINDYFNEREKIANFSENYNGEQFFLKQEFGFFEEPYYVITREDTKLLYYGQLKENKPDGIGVIVRLVDVSIGKNDVGEMETIDVYECSGWYSETTYVAKVYIGNFKEGRPEGYGRKYCAPGDDDYFTNRINVENYKDKEVQEIIFDMANPIRYEGNFKEGKYSGKGTEYIYTEYIMGDYVGELLELNKEDIAIIYSGTYEENKKNGEFKVYMVGQLGYEGSMKNDEYHGIGTEYYLSGQIKYKGEFLYGKYDGEGTLYNEDGSVSYSGKWDSNDYAH